MRKHEQLHWRSALAATLGALLAGTPMVAGADDIDIFSSNKYGLRPNVLFVLDYSGSMDDEVTGMTDYPDGSPAIRRIDLLRNAVTSIVDTHDNAINAGVLLYSNTSSGVLWPVVPIDADASMTDSAITSAQTTGGDIIKRMIMQRSPSGSTATVDALVEAAQYFSGGSVLNGTLDSSSLSENRPPVWNNADLRYDNVKEGANRYSYLPTEAYEQMPNPSGEVGNCQDYSISGGTNFCLGRQVTSCTSVPETVQTVDPLTGELTPSEVTPAHDDCSFTKSNAFTANYKSPIEHSCQANHIVLVTDGQPTEVNEPLAESYLGRNFSSCENISSIFSSDYQTAGDCGKEIVSELYNRDQIAGIPESRVHTHAVGFMIDDVGATYLQDLVSPGVTPDQPKYHLANNQAELNQALNSLVGDIIESSESFSEVSVDIDRAGFSHDDKAYFPLFRPSGKSYWNGNLKGYFFTEAGFTDTNGNIATEVGDNGTQFSDIAQSFWSATPDGNYTHLGGANEQVVNQARRLYTYTDTSIPNGGVTLSGNTAYQLRDTNTNITTELLGLPTGSSLRTPTLNWAQDAAMGAPLHSSPTVVQYEDRKVIYVMTNQGFVHAIDATTPNDPNVIDHTGGSEIFAFIPPELLRNLPKAAGYVSTSEFVYGLDGQMTRWHDDANFDGVVNSGESVILVFGMRRGGHHYYAMDITDPDAPRYLWRISSGDVGFEKLAQSWSRATLVKVRRGGAVERVLVFGGGYDADTLDDQGDLRIDSAGAAIYMVDRGGQLVWSVDSSDHSEMRYSIASNLSVVDVDRDGVADRIYTGDVAGQVWRVDFDDISISTDTRVTRFADLGSEHPFFQPPSVAWMQSGYGDFLAVSLGSGNRTDPVDETTRNALFMMRDSDTTAGMPDPGFSMISSTQLYDATNNDLASTSGPVAASAQTELQSKRGWMVRLQQGEKALTPLLSYDGRLLATTFHPNDPEATLSCGYTTLNRFWSMDISNAIPSPIPPFDSVDISNAESRYRPVKGQTIAASPRVIFTKEGRTPKVVVGKEAMGDITTHLEHVYWYAK